MFAVCRGLFSFAVLLALLFGLMPASRAAAQGYAPGEAASKMSVPDGLSVSLYAAEPMVRQPVAIEFDDRGRLWVVQYLQYPNPEGLERVSVDRYSRTTYDRVPEAPPHGPKGADRVTILLDADGDGVAESEKDFVSGLNLASGLAFGYDGVFILQAPYLLFYPDRDRDDAPDSDPEVCLTGFGMEDAHSVANSLTWGPDGWLYGNQGSTVTANIRGIEFQQGVWRYHPRTKAFELFCEGGGNMWGLDFDAEGQLLASTNFGPYIMIHGIQGGYYWKSFGKHGDLHNPFTYGYFDHVTHHDATGGHVAVGGHIYRGGALGAPYAGSYVAANLLSHTLYWHTVTPHGATFESKHGGTVLDSNDTWFAPSDLTTGPDGALYVCDWHDARMAHPDPDASWDKSNGRIYRIAPENHPVGPAFDLREYDNAALAELLGHENAWFARRARVLLATRNTDDIAPVLARQVDERAKRERALESLWALYASGQLEERHLVNLLDDDDYAFRLWGARLLADHGAPSAEASAAVSALAARESDVRVQAQLAATAQRLAPGPGLATVSGLLAGASDTDDLFVPLLVWWALEKHAAQAGEHLDALLAARGPLADTFVLPRLVRRLVAEGAPAWDDLCARLLRESEPRGRLETLIAAILPGLADREGRAASDMRGALYDQFSEAAVEDTPARRQAAPLSPALEGYLIALWENAPDDAGRLAIAAQLGHPPALEAALAAVRNPAAAEETRRTLLDTVSRAAGDAMAEELLAITVADGSLALRGAALDALRRVNEPEVGAALAEAYPSLPAGLQGPARQALLSRAAWTGSFLDLVERGSVRAEDVPVSELRRVAQHGDDKLDALVKEHWGSVSGGTPEFLLAEMRRLNNDLRAKPGDPVKGAAVYAANCAQCHAFFGQGFSVGPDLTQSNRMDTEYLLGSIVNPNMVVRKEYVQFLVETSDGGFYNGIVSERSPGSVTLLNANGATTTIPMGDVEEIREAGISLMPEGILGALSPDEVRDLFAYMQAPEPPAAPAEPSSGLSELHNEDTNRGAAPVYRNTLTKLADPPPLLADFPQYVQPVIEETRYAAPALVKDADADLHVRAWRFSYNARGIIEMPNHLRAKETAIVVVHPWAIDDNQGWRTPEPAGVADFCTPTKNHISHLHIRDVLNPFLQQWREKVGMVVYSQRADEKPVLAKIYRTIRKTPTPEERAEGKRELAQILNGFDYNAGDLPETLALGDDLPVVDYFRQFPGLDSGDHYNGPGFWELPVPVVDTIEVDPNDVVHYDADGYPAIRDFLKAHGIRHILLTGYATDMCYKSTTCGYDNFSKDFNVFLVGDATLATFPANSSPAYATNAAISFASLNQLITQVSWITGVDGGAE